MRKILFIFCVLSACTSPEHPATQGLADTAGTAGKVLHPVPDRTHTPTEPSLRRRLPDTVFSQKDHEINLYAFLDDVIVRSEISMRIYDKYFGQTSEIEYIMEGAYERHILVPFKFSGAETTSITLAYLQWRITSACRDTTGFKVVLHKEISGGRIFKVECASGNVFYFTYSMDRDLLTPKIVHVYDEKKITLIPDHDVFSKARW